MGLFMSCCDLSWPEPCSDRTVLCAFCLPRLQILICGTWWSPALGCVCHPVTGCAVDRAAGGCEPGVRCGLTPTADSIEDRPKPGLTTFLLQVSQNIRALCPQDCWPARPSFLGWHRWPCVFCHLSSAVCEGPNLSAFGSPPSSSQVSALPSP